MPGERNEEPERSSLAKIPSPFREILVAGAGSSHYAILS